MSDHHKAIEQLKSTAGNLIAQERLGANVGAKMKVVLDRALMLLDKVVGPEPKAKKPTEPTEPTGEGQ